MRTLRWLWPVLLLSALILVPWGIYVAQPERRLELVVVDKTVPFRTWIEHRSLFWLLDHLKIARPDGARYDVRTDYVGAHPPARPGAPPESTDLLTPERVAGASLVYLADTYGVYRDDLLSGPEMKAALERSPKIFGGLEPSEAQAAAGAARAGKTLIAEFNTLASPTGDEARAVLEDALGVRWTGWIGRYFTDLGDPEEVPAWMRRNYESEWRTPWEFSGSGYVLLQGDARVEVLRCAAEAERVGLVLGRVSPPDPVLSEARDGVPYPYWFDLVEPRPGTDVLARFTWRLTDLGKARMAERGLPLSFPAVTRRGSAWYFAGDFADNPMDTGERPFAGYPAVKRVLEGGGLAPSETAFYWRFYVPLMTRILAGLPGA